MYGLECGILNKENKVEELLDLLKSFFKEIDGEKCTVKSVGDYITIDHPSFETPLMYYTARGNKKLSKSELITNNGSGTRCISDMLTLCPYGEQNGDGTCYCLKAENQYPNCLPCRDNNEKVFDFIVENGLGFELTYGLILKWKQARNKFDYHRINESGDIKSWEHLVVLELIAEAFSIVGVQSFLYTHREDMMDAFVHCKYLIINGSDFMVDNEFRVVDEFTGDNLKCCGDCRICIKVNRAYCMRNLGKVIEVIKH